MNMHGFIHTIAIAALRAVLLLALFGAGWSIYRRLPHDNHGNGSEATNESSGTTVRLILRPSANNVVPIETATFRFYSVDVIEAQRKFEAERKEAQRNLDSRRRVGVRFDDFLVQQMGRRQPVAGQFDERGEATASVPPGKWWVHAELKGRQQNISWRLPPINISGRARVIELTPENSYTRAKSF
ncbi:MAG: hypothetical protein M3430_12295 [Acidobacteriota bacterium]|nr:hypothetical protein [Acidobacteriota bacterium]